MLIHLCTGIACSEDNVLRTESSPLKSDEPEIPKKIEPRTYYVLTSTGNDVRIVEPAKIMSTPWKIIQKAVNSIVGGDTEILVRLNIKI